MILSLSDHSSHQPSFLNSIYPPLFKTPDNASGISVCCLSGKCAPDISETGPIVPLCPIAFHRVHFFRMRRIKTYSSNRDNEVSTRLI